MPPANNGGGANNNGGGGGGGVPGGGQQQQQQQHATSVILSIANGIDDGGVDSVVSPGKRARLDALADAEHLDRLEASEAVTDIASFQDIELPLPDPNRNASNGEQDGMSVASESVPRDSVRRAKRFYYCLPMMQRYYIPIMGCLIAVALLATAIGLTVSGARSGHWAEEEALQAQFGGGDAREGEGNLKIDDAPDPQGGGNSGWGGYYGEQQAGGDQQQGDEELGDSHGAMATDTPTVAPRPDPPGMSPITARPPVPAPPSPATPYSPPATKTWFETTHARYQEFLSAGAAEGDNGAHVLATLFCASQGMTLCSEADYCPFGSGNAPYLGGPPNVGMSNTLKRIQWAPAASEGHQWLQVGKLPESKGGKDANGYGACWAYEEWITIVERNIEEVVSEDHRRWMLCCPEDRR